MLDKVKTEVPEEKMNEPFIKITGNKVLLFRSSFTDRARTMGEAIHDYDLHYTSSITASNASADKGLKRIQKRRVTKAQKDSSKRIAYAKNLTKKRRDQAKAHNRRVSRDHFRDKTNVAVLLRSASTIVALGTLVGVIAQKNNISIAHEVQKAIMPHVGNSRPAQITISHLLDPV